MIAQHVILRDRERARAIWHRIGAALGAMIDRGPVELILRPAKSKRSLEQNKRYWELLNQLAAAVEINGRRFSAEVWHEHWKRELIGREELILPTGEIEQRGISTTTLNVSEFGDYMSRIEAWAATEHGVIVMADAA